MPVDAGGAIRQVLEKLEGDRARIDRQIEGLKQALSAVDAAGRDGLQMPAKGRPRRGRRSMSSAQRKAVGQRMKAYWAKRRAKAGKRGGRKKK